MRIIALFMALTFIFTKSVLAETRLLQKYTVAGDWDAGIYTTSSASRNSICKASKEERHGSLDVLIYLSVGEPAYKLSYTARGRVANELEIFAQQKRRPLSLKIFAEQPDKIPLANRGHRGVKFDLSHALNHSDLANYNEINFSYHSWWEVSDVRENVLNRTCDESLTALEQLRCDGILSPFNAEGLISGSFSFSIDLEEVRGVKRRLEDECLPALRVNNMR